MAYSEFIQRSGLKIETRTKRSSGDFFRFSFARKTHLPRAGLVFHRLRRDITISECPTRQRTYSNGVCSTGWSARVWSHASGDVANAAYRQVSASESEVQIPLNTRSDFCDVIGFELPTVSKYFDCSIMTDNNVKFQQCQCRNRFHQTSLKWRNFLERGNTASGQRPRKLCATASASTSRKFSRFREIWLIRDW